MHDAARTEICRYLDDYGWRYNSDEPDVIVTGFLGEQDGLEFNMFIVVSEQWIGLTVWPVLASSEAESDPMITQQMCLLNYTELKLARLARTRTGDLVLCIDLPITDLSRSLFHRSLDILSYYAVKYHSDFSISSGTITDTDKASNVTD